MPISVKAALVKGLKHGQQTGGVPTCIGVPPHLAHRLLPSLHQTGKAQGSRFQMVTYTTEQCDPEDKPRLEKFVSCFSKPPAVLSDEQSASPEEMRQMLKVVVKEFSRQFNVNVAACIVGGKEGDTVLTTQYVRVLKEAPTASLTCKQRMRISR
ncbi:hypothetical protein FS749_011439 [Ceratobasidium sp. UAMH 11750]|nr:hypothetical protein FS749_011439 [Ceratobasidium sp. UAMH 11750]